MFEPFSSSFYFPSFITSSYLFRSLLLPVLLVTLLCFSGCTEHQQEELTGGSAYSLYIMDKEGNEYLVPVSSLKKDTVNPEKQGIKISQKEIHRDMIVNDGFYYYKQGEKFIKYTVEQGALKEAGSVKLADFYLANYRWVDQDTLLLFAVDYDSYKVKYARVNVADMTVREGTITLPGAYPKYNFMMVGFSELRNQQLFIGYTYYAEEASGYSALDTVYVAVLSYPEMKVQQIRKDTRSVNPGGENMVEPGSFSDETGDFYFLACPGVAMGNHPSKPTGLYRIKANEDRLDSSYFFNLSESSIRNHAYSIYYIGGGKAIVRSERKDLFTSWNDHWKVPHFEFYVVDLSAQSVKRLLLPLDKGTRRQCVLVENGKVYISVNSDIGGNCIWEYDPEHETLVKGLSLTGNTDYIMRMDKIR